MDEYQAPPQKSWWGRNWFWVVPVGCLTPVVLIIGCFAAAFFAVSGLIKSSDVYVHSMNAVQADNAVKAALGEPISPSVSFSGNVNLTNDNGHADITYGITGPKGAANVHVVADKNAGQWTYTTNRVHIDGANQDIDVPVPAAAK